MIAVRVIVDGGEMLAVLLVVAALMLGSWAYGRTSRQ